MTVFAALGLLLLVAALVYVLYPILRPVGAGASDDAEARELRERRRQLYRQILDVEFDQRVGKLQELDARELSERLLSQASNLVARESCLQLALDDEIEREIRELRTTLALQGSVDPVRNGRARRPISGSAGGPGFSGAPEAQPDSE